MQGPLSGHRGRITASPSRARVRFRAYRLRYSVSRASRRRRRGWRPCVPVSYTHLLGVGCLIANLFSPYGVLDIVVGSLATLIAALITSRCRNVWLAALPPVACNMVLVGAVLAYEQAGTSAAFWPAYGLNAATVGAGEAIACLVLGVLLVKQLPRIPYFRDRLQSR